MAKEITSSVEALEVEAEKILETAKTRASEILLKPGKRRRKYFPLSCPSMR